MTNEAEFNKKSEAFLDEIGMTPAKWLSTMGKYNSRLLQISEANYRSFSALYEKIINKDFQKKDKGKLLEELTYLLFYQSYEVFFECRKNLHTSSNEIDLQVCWTENARMTGLNNAFPFLGESFLCECKNYKKKVDVTYVGKFFSLLRLARCKTGIMIAWDGITERSKWTDASGLIRKIALKDDTYIITIEKKDLQTIYEKKSNIFSILHNKFYALQNEIDYSTFIQPHEMESVFK